MEFAELDQRCHQRQLLALIRRRVCWHPSGSPIFKLLSVNLRTSEPSARITTISPSGCGLWECSNASSLIAAPRARKRDPLAVRRLCTVRIGTPGMGQSFQIGPVWPDALDFIIAVSVRGECDSIPQRQPDRKLGSGSERTSRRTAVGAQTRKREPTPAFATMTAMCGSCVCNRSPAVQRNPFGFSHSKSLPSGESQPICRITGYP
jgi:hypothetical protein